MHSNKIETLSKTDALVPLTKLRNLTLHGNPVEESRGYRLAIVGRVPGLKHLDFSPVTKADRTLCRKLKMNCYVKGGREGKRDGDDV